MKNYRVILIIVIVILLIPLIAMQFTTEIVWTPIDFLVAGVLLFGTGVILDLILKKVRKPYYRITLSVALFIILILIWAELAVGIFGSPFAGT